MGTPQLFLGIDLGTSGVRIAVINNNLDLLHSDSINYLSGLEQSIDWQNSCDLLIKNIPKSIRSNLAAVAIDGTSGTLLPCSLNGKPLGQALPYHLTCPETKREIEKLVPKESPAASLSSSLAKALRLIDEYGTNILLRNQADWITGNFLDDWTWGEEGNNLRLGWNIEKGSWPSSFESLSWRKALPIIVPSGKIIGVISNKKSKKLGLPSTLYVVAGTTDSNAAVLSSDATYNDGITVLGSTLVLKKYVESPVIAPGITNHRIGEKWLCGGASNSGCAVLKNFFSSKEIDQLSRQINPKVKSGLNLRPLACIGERFPIEDPYLSPILEPRPISDALYLHGLLEGITNIEAIGWAKFEELGIPAPKRIITLGGGSKNPQWRQLRKKILKLPITTSSRIPAAGVAIIAQEAFKFINQ